MSLAFTRALGTPPREGVQSLGSGLHGEELRAYPRIRGDEQLLNINKVSGHPQGGCLFPSASSSSHPKEKGVGQWASGQESKRRRSPHRRDGVEGNSALWTIELFY